LPASSDLTLIGFRRIGLGINSDNRGSHEVFFIAGSLVSNDPPTFALTAKDSVKVAIMMTHSYK